MWLGMDLLNNLGEAVTFISSFIRVDDWEKDLLCLFIQCIRHLRDSFPITALISPIFRVWLSSQPL
jgi:hypothetical protein